MTTLDAPRSIGYASWVQTVVSSFSGQSNCLSIPVPFLRFCGSYEAAAFLSQSLYWSDRTKNADGWFYKSYVEWENELCLSEFQVRRLSKWFGQFNLIQTQLKKQNGAPTLHYRVDSEVFAELFLKFLKNPDAKSFLKVFESEETQDSNLKKLKNGTLSDSGMEPLVTQEWIPEPLRNDLYTQITHTDPTTDPTNTRECDSDESRSRAQEDFLPVWEDAPDQDCKEQEQPDGEKLLVPSPAQLPKSSDHREVTGEIKSSAPTKNSAKSKKAEPAIEVEAFDQWWASYRQFAVSVDASAGSRAEAAKEWNKLLMSEADCLSAFLEGAEWYQRCKVGQHEKRGEAIGVPHGCRFIKNRLWEEAVMHKQRFYGQSAETEAKPIKPAVVDLSEALASIGAHLRRLDWSPMQRIEHLQAHYSCQTMSQLTDPQVFDFMEFLERQMGVPQ